MRRSGHPPIKWPPSMERHQYEHEPCPPASRGRGCIHDSPMHTCTRQGCHLLYYTEARHWVCINFEKSERKGAKTGAIEAAGSGKRLTPWCPNLAPGSTTHKGPGRV